MVDFVRQRQMEKVFLQTSLERNPSNASYIFLLDMNFENLTIVLHVLYVLNTYVIFHSLDAIYYSINKLIFMHNFRSQKFEI